MRKMKMLVNALDNCNLMLKDDPDQLIIMYHKLRILYALEKYEESLEICDKILQKYPKNGDVLFDKAVSLINLNRISKCLETLSFAIQISDKFKIKARSNKALHILQKNDKFLKLIK